MRPVSASGDEDISGRGSSEPRSMDRRQFGGLVAVASAGALLGSQPALSAVANTTHPSRAMMLRTRMARFSVDTTGALSAITVNGQTILAPGEPAPVLSVRVASKLHAANHAAWDEKSNILTLGFDGIEARALLAIHAKPTHITLELTALHSTVPVELVLWGPYPISIGDLVGEVVGVVRNAELAVGIQALNTKTLGGDASQESDVEPDELVADDAGRLSRLARRTKETAALAGQHSNSHSVR